MTNSMLSNFRVGRTLAVSAAAALALSGCSTTTSSLPRAPEPNSAFERAAHVRSFSRIAAELVPALPVSPLSGFHATDLHPISVQEVPGDQRDAGLRLHHHPPHFAHAAPLARHTATNMIAAESGGQSNQLVTISGFDDVYANITLYSLSDFKLQSPYTDTNRLYAPTVKPGLGDSGRGCYEVSAFYESDSADQVYAAQNRLAVFDWCNGSGGRFDKFYTIDNNFRAQYVRNFGDGLPKATIEIAQPLGLGGEWKAMIYNYSNRYWEDLDARGPGYASTEDPDAAWAIFETHFNAGPCPAFPRIGVSNFQVAVEPGGDDSRNFFRAPLGSELSGSGSLLDGCFVNDHSGIGEYYTFNQSATDSWTVTDPPSGNGSYYIVTCTTDQTGTVCDNGSQRPPASCTYIGSGPGPYDTQYSCEEGA